MEEQVQAMPDNNVSEPVNTGSEVSEASQESQSTEEAVKDYVSRRDYNKVMEERRKMQSQIKELESLKERSSDLEFVDLLRGSSPEKMKQIVEILYAQEQAQESSDPYRDWDQDAAQKFREVDELKQRLSAFEQAQQEREKQADAHNMKTLEDSFYNLLSQDGFVDEKGKYDENLIGILSEATMGQLKGIAKNPQKATINELKQAWSTVKSGIDALEKRTLKRNVSPSVPPTGSKNGIPPVKKEGFASDSDRVNYISKFIGSGR